MSVRELQKAVNRLKEVEEECSLTKADKDNLQKTLADRESLIGLLTAERDSLKTA